MSLANGTITYSNSLVYNRGTVATPACNPGFTYVYNTSASLTLTCVANPSGGATASTWNEPLGSCAAIPPWYDGGGPLRGAANAAG